MKASVWIVRDAEGDRNFYRLSIDNDMTPFQSFLVDLDLDTAVKLCQRLSTLLMTA